MTEKVYEELKDAKAEIQRLKSENSEKSVICENLKITISSQLTRIRELSQQAQKVEKLLVALEDANAKILCLQNQKQSFMDNIDTLKQKISSDAQEKRVIESKMAKVSSEMREVVSSFQQLEVEKVKVEEKLKWRNEQFNHLEEAHDNARNNLRMKEKEWDMDRRTFHDVISTLETKLEESQTTTTDHKMAEELNCCRLELERKETRLKDVMVLKLTIKKEESALMVVALKSILLEASQKLKDDLEVAASEVTLKEDLKEKEKRINNLEEEIKELKENNTKEMELWAKKFEADEYKKQNLNQLVEEKDQRINNLLQQIMISLKKEFEDATASFSSQLARKQAEMTLFHEAWEKMRTIVVIKEVEVQERDLMITELEKDLENLSSKNENLLKTIA